MNLPDYTYLDYIGDFFFAKVKMVKYKTKEMFCLRPYQKCPITGNRQFWKKCLRIVFEDGHSTTFYCELYAFEEYLLTTDFDQFPSYNKKRAYY